ncbi:unnamed protein product [Blepharisma stoltei]|uniref:Uncharacterized protein n=1 Tax=Blepharisma stoltei TaxID=1481888 RepID=A0AAU9ILS3_9CILI|nr:unnamed protein product [Blepharisma stoltei]
MLIAFLLCAIKQAVSSSSSGITLSGTEPTFIFNQDDHPFQIDLINAKLQLGNGEQNCIEYEEGENIYINANEIAGDTAFEVENTFSLNGVNQWRLIHSEDFTSPTGWSNNANSECAGIVMLGGYCQFSSSEVAKTFLDLPSHSSIKIKATFHFIDAWIGEAAYLKVDLEGKYEYVWNESYKAGQASSGINICGAHHAEGKFSSDIEVNLPHSDSSLSVVFGTTLDQDPCDESWGVSSFEIFIR